MPWASAEASAYENRACTYYNESQSRFIVSCIRKMDAYRRHITSMRAICHSFHLLPVYQSLAHIIQLNGKGNDLAFACHKR